MPAQRDLLEYYQILLGHFGPCNWWPAESPFEVAVGVILTQNTNWRNVEKALANLKTLGPLTPGFLWSLPAGALEEAIRPSGFFNQKAIRLRNLLRYFAEKNGGEVPPDDTRLEFLQADNLYELRQELLSIKGIGEESADSILLYALQKPIFVIDAYTWRILHRHGFVGEDTSYAEMQEIFMSVLPEDTQLYNEYHALIVHAGKHFCSKNNPKCSGCPLEPFLEYRV